MSSWFYNFQHLFTTVKHAGQRGLVILLCFTLLSSGSLSEYLHYEVSCEDNNCEDNNDLKGPFQPE